MQLALRPYVTAGAALVGGGTIAVTPLAPPLPDLPDIQSPAVQLTAGEVDILGPWITQFNDASMGASTLANNFFLAPGVGLQQAIVNQVDFLGEVLNNPSSLPDVLNQFSTNLQSVLSAFLLVGANSDTISTVTGNTLDTLHSLLLSNIPSFLPAGLSPQVVELITQGLNFLSSPVSGMILGAEGPFISPGVALLNSTEAIAGALSAGDQSAALQDLIAAPANFVGSFFNGATLNLDALVPLINGSGVLPSGTTINALSYAFGGLLSAGAVGETYHLYDSTGTAIAAIPAVGGSMLNSTGLDISTVFDGIPITLDIPGQAVGPLAPFVGLSEAIGALLGDGWDAKNAPATPPLATLTFPTLPDGSVSNALPAEVLNSFSGLNDLSSTLPADVLNSLSGLASLPHELITTLLTLF